MRILLLPLTRRHTLLYAQRLTENDSHKPHPWLTWALHKAQQTWAEWGKSDTKWKSKTVATGNKLLDQVDWEEYALKTVHDPMTISSVQVMKSVTLTRARLMCRYPLCILAGLRGDKLMRLLRRWFDGDDRYIRRIDGGGLLPFHLPYHFLSCLVSDMKRRADW